MLGIGFLGIFSCAGPHSSTLPKSEQVVVIIENCPIQTSTNKVGHNISQTAYSTIDYIDKDGNLIEYNPCLAGRDTIILPTFHGYAEMMHVCENTLYYGTKSFPAEIRLTNGIFASTEIALSKFVIETTNTTASYAL